MTLGEWLAAARKEAGLSYAETTYRLRAHLPESMWVSLETIRRLERRVDPDPVLAAALARVYGKSRQEMPPALVEQLDRVAAVLSGGGPGSPYSAWVTADELRRCENEAGVEAVAAAA